MIVECRWGEVGMPDTCGMLMGCGLNAVSRPEGIVGGGYVSLSDVSTLGVQPALRRRNVRAMIGVRILMHFDSATERPNSARASK